MGRLLIGVLAMVSLTGCTAAEVTSVVAAIEAVWVLVAPFVAQ